MNTSEKKLYNKLKKTIQNLEYDEDIKTFHHTFCETMKDIQPKQNIKIGLINIPCKGFGDIQCCDAFSNYLKQWYPRMKITIFTTTAGLKKYKLLGILSKSLSELKEINKQGDDGECEPFNNLKIKKKTDKQDILIVVPMVNEEFSINKLRKLVPYASIYNSFAVSEYNGEYGPYAFPIGIGDDQLGLLLTDNIQLKKPNYIQSPYVLSYIAGGSSGNCSIHSNSCMLSFIEMICKKYNKYKKLQLIINPWFCSDDENEISLLSSPQLKSRFNRIVKKYFSHCKLVLKDNQEKILFTNEKSKKKNIFILRGDILPKPRKDFISLIKYSLPDVLLTGDQSLTDGLAYSSLNKIIWYQICPWKTELADELSKQIPNKYLDNFRTSCGTLKGIHIHPNNKNLLKHNDFRKKGKLRMDSILKFYSLLDHPIIKILTECIEHSRYKETTLKKFEKQIELKYKL